MALKEKWSTGAKVLNGWLAIPDGFATETMAHQGWDSLTIDMQHGMIDYTSAVNMLTAMSTKSAIPVVRVPWCEPGIIMKMLDVGALGIICPMINNAQDAANFVSYLKYPPQGQRSYGPIRAMLTHGAGYGAAANDLVTGFAMIETREALDNLEAILQTPGLDAIYIGPADLALALGAPARFDPIDERVTAAIRHVLARAKHHGKYAGIHNSSAEYAARMASLGFDFVTVGSDVRFMAVGAAAAVSAFRAIPLDVPSNGY